MLIRFVAIIVMLVLPAFAFAENLKMAVYPSNDPQKLIVPMRILADYLTENGGQPFEAVVTRDYQELYDRLKNETVDMAWINPVNYIKMKAEMPSLRYIATYMERNEETGEITPYYRSFIVARKDSGITSLAEARGKRFSFTDKGSTSGYAYPHMLLRNRGIVPADYFAKVFFLKKHDRVIEALVSGAIDIGAVSDGTYYTAVRNHGDIFRIIEKSEFIPLDAIVAPGHIPEYKVDRYRKILTQMPADHPFNRQMKESLGWNAAGFQKIDDDFYNIMRKAIDVSQ